MEKDLTKGSVTINILLFALPLMFGNLLQQFYNIADTYIVGKYLGSNALAAVGSSYTLMTFLTSILIGLCMGASAVISIQYGKCCYAVVLNTVLVIHQKCVKVSLCHLYLLPYFH